MAFRLHQTRGGFEPSADAEGVSDLLVEPNTSVLVAAAVDRGKYLGARAVSIMLWDGLPELTLSNRHRPAEPVLAVVEAR